jgi:hypothetical protein
MVGGELKVDLEVEYPLRSSICLTIVSKQRTSGLSQHKHISIHYSRRRICRWRRLGYIYNKIEGGRSGVPQGLHLGDSRAVRMALVSQWHYAVLIPNGTS